MNVICEENSRFSNLLFLRFHGIPRGSYVTRKWHTSATSDWMKINARARSRCVTFCNSIQSSLCLSVLLTFKIKLNFFSFVLFSFR